MTLKKRKPFAGNKTHEASAMLTAEDLPPLPDAEEVPARRLAWLASRRAQEIEVPPALIKAIEVHGWLYVGANEGLAFFERPGYWLRVYPDSGNWIASVMPETHRVPRPKLGAIGYQLRFPDNMLPPEIRGSGARAKALALAAELWRQHEGYLATLGIRLGSVGVRQYRGSGSGGYVDKKVYLAKDIEETAV